MPTVRVKTEQAKARRMSIKELEGECRRLNRIQSAANVIYWTELQDRSDPRKAGFFALLRDSFRRKEERHYAVKGHGRALWKKIKSHKYRDNYWRKEIVIPVIVALIVAFIIARFPSIFGGHE